MKFIITVDNNKQNKVSEKIVSTKEELMTNLFDIFSRFNILEHTHYLKSKGFSQKDILRYGTLGTYSLFLIGEDFNDISEFNYKISETSVTVSKLLDNNKISVI